MTADATRDRVPIPYSAVLLVVAVLGLTAAFQLTLDKFEILANPKFVPSCSVSPFIECATNLTRPEGSVFGFPNPLIGMMGWSVVITIAVATLAGARFARWFWVGMNLGLLGALVFCIWLMSQSFLVIGKLCTWCALTWTVTIIAVVITTALNLARGVFGRGARPAGRFLLRWSPVVSLALLLTVAVLAQLKWGLIQYFFA